MSWGERPGWAVLRAGERKDGDGGGKGLQQLTGEP